MTTTLPDQTMDDKVGFNYSRGVIPVIPEEVDDFETEVTRFRQGKTEEAVFMAYRLIRGVYGQRQPDVHMMRVKIPLGALTADQIDVLGQVVSRYAPLQKGHVTTRENLQFHFLNLERTPEIMRLFGAVGLSTREACGNTVRNVTGCPLAGVTPDEPFYVSPYAAAFVRWFVRHPYTQKLPRKFKTAFASCSRDCVVTGIHDLGFLPRIQQDENGAPRKGFRIVTGGGTAIMPRIADTLFDFVPVEEYLKVSEAVIRVFYRCDELRKNRARARLKFHIDRVGIDAFREEVAAELRKPWAKRSFDPTPLMELPEEQRDALPPTVRPDSADHREPEFRRWVETNVVAQKQKGYNAAWVKLPLGDIQAHQFPVLARIARSHAGGRARTTLEQNLVFRWVPDGHLYDVWRELNEVGLGEGGVHQITDVVACPSTDSCKLGITSSMGLGRAIKEAVSEVAVDDPLVQSMHIKISGCPNGCGQHHIANIGFQGAATKGDGNQVPAYEVLLAGSYGTGQTARIGQRLKTKVPAKQVPHLLRAVIEHYQGQRQEGETFNQFVDRVGTEPFEAIAGRFRGVGPLNRENIGTYMDWGKTILYKVERGEGECAV